MNKRTNEQTYKQISKQTKRQIQLIFAKYFVNIVCLVFLFSYICLSLQSGFTPFWHFYPDVVWRSVYPFIFYLSTTSFSSLLPPPPYSPPSLLDDLGTRKERRKRQIYNVFSCLFSHSKTAGIYSSP